jgi:CRP-like cAMP-binding protein
MTQIVFAGPTLPEQAVLDALYARGYSLLIEPRVYGMLSSERIAQPSLMVLSIAADTPVARIGHMLHQRAIPWIAWSRADDPALTLTAYAAGAFAVLPTNSSASILLQAIDNVLTAQPPARVNLSHIHTLPYRYRRGEVIPLEQHALLTVVQGIVAQTMVHSDGAEVLLGLFGPGQLLIGHPDDACSLQMIAHTDAAVSVCVWDDAITDPTLPERLRTRVQVLEEWAAMQARPYLDQRILGILSLLAEQFGRTHPQGMLVDVRITHAQLATTVGATRSTVTRVLGDLRTRGLLSTLGSGERERFCLRRWEASDHGMRPQSVLIERAVAEGVG